MKIGKSGKPAPWRRSANRAVIVAGGSSLSARWWLDLWIRPRMSSMARAWVVRQNAGPPAHPVGGEGREVVAAAAVVDAEQEAVVHHPQRLQQRAVSLQLRRQPARRSNSCLAFRTLSGKPECNLDGRRLADDRSLHRSSISAITSRASPPAASG